MKKGDIILVLVILLVAGSAFEYIRSSPGMMAALLSFMWTGRKKGVTAWIKTEPWR